MKQAIFQTVLVCVAALVFSVGVLAQEFAVKQTLEPYVSSGDLVGFVTIIASKDAILQVDTIGYKDLVTKTPMQKDTMFWVASQSKPIAAAAVMILVDDGKLSLDEPITAYLPEFKEARLLQSKDDRQTVLVPLPHPATLRQLLSHTSGMDWGAPLHHKFGFDILSFTEEATVFPTVPFIAPPGTKSIYSNMGINTAAMIVERVSGKPYFEFLQERLFKPLGMKDTTFWPDLNRLATAYWWKGKEKELAVKINDRFSQPLDDLDRHHPDAAAGLFSTAEDIVRFYQMLLGKGMFNGKRILSEEAVSEITKKQTGDNVPSKYGLGMAILPDGYGHGGTFGTNTTARPAIDRILVYMTQEHGLPKGNEAREAFLKLAR